MKIAIVALVLFFYIEAHASFVTSDNLTAKIQSGVKGQPPRYFGSGFTFMYKAQVYILTSDHVLARDNGSYAHKVSMHMGSYDAVYVASDWGHRFALLKLLNVPPDNLKYENLTEYPNVSYGDKGWTFIATGFGINATEPLINQSKNWHTTTQYPDVAFQVPTLIESDNAHSEFGMSGGGVFNPVSMFYTDYVGVLSHQVFNLATGKIEELQAGATLASNRMLTIPFTSIKSVIGDILDNGTSKNWNFYEPMKSNLNNEVVDTGLLTLSLKKDPTTGLGNTLKVQIVPSRVAVTTLYPDTNGWLAKMNSQLAQAVAANPDQDTVEVTGWLNPATNEVTALSVSGISQFLRLLESNSLEPVLK